MKKAIALYEDLPLELDKSYKTKFQTGELFLVKEIMRYSFEPKKAYAVKGIYVDSPHLGICPLDIERLYPDRKEIGVMEVCGKCGTKIE